MRRYSLLKTAVAGVACTALTVTGCAATQSRIQTPEGGYSLAVGEPDHLTPGRTVVSMDQIHALFAPLATVSDSGKLSYVQARSVTSRDSRHWTVRLRHGWTFHNGEPVTARSYADSWNRAAYGPNAWPTNGQLSGIEGFAALNPAKGKPKKKRLSGVRVTGRYTLKVTLAAPDSQFPYQLTDNQGAFFPLPKSAFTDPAAYDRKPVGNGPFRMTKAWERNRGATVTAYRDYRGPKPAATGITFKSYTDLGTAYTDALAGNTDVLAAPVDKLGQVGRDFPGRVHRYEAPSMEMLSLPLYDKRYRDPDLRRALSLAINRKAVDKAMTGGLNTPASSLVPPAEVGAETGVCDECRYDPERARKLLKKAGGWHGPMVLTYPGGQGLDDLYQALANQLRQNLGIDAARAQATADWAEFSEKVIGKKVTGPFYGHWGALYPSMQNTLRGIYTKTGDCFTCSFYSHPDVDKLLSRADSSTSPGRAARLYNDAQKRILKDFPTIPLFYGSYVYVSTERVSGASIGPFGLRLAGIGVEP
ncbi:ABC transporter substrate-binding protein [Streptomyces sp. NBC_01795]|uniref:peptide ABC transporter substrate-binding protein n=1 Tax=unclassified Streptomyces TaxID=2593676 RepID=UPI002DD8E123|nr:MULTISPECIES: ABC transporter substrate-binding protein [unclassified Streptomyces]WSA92585.1 ABC transporter substrate-binding protein [Streptomyces sp. NBC_01795]WSS14775.1 ABC transporter substrate-binding protein [Streptomyces sp. NBC_01186]